MEISDFLRKQESLPTLPDNYKENAEWEEERSFQAWIKKYPVEEHSDIEEHIRYIRKSFYVILILTEKNILHRGMLLPIMISGKKG